MDDVRFAYEGAAHEFSGCVEEKGKNVTNVDVGDKVVSRLNINVCGVCKPCMASWVYSERC